METKFGPVQLGRLYDIRYRLPGGEPLRLCVVAEGNTSLPKGDIWTNLLLVLHNDPEQFFEVANWKRGRGDWNLGAVPGRASEIGSPAHRSSSLGGVNYRTATLSDKGPSALFAQWE